MLLKGNLFPLFCSVQKTTTMGLPAGQISQKTKKLRTAVYSDTFVMAHVKKAGTSGQLFGENKLYIIE